MANPTIAPAPQVGQPQAKEQTRSLIHHFDVDDAMKYGPAAAVILSNLRHWCAKNAANDRHFYDGRHWTYNSIAAFCKLFPYMTENQIRGALDRLVTAKAILKGHWHGEAYDQPFDRTAWYAIADEPVGSPSDSRMHLGNSTNGLAENPKCRARERSPSQIENQQIENMLSPQDGSATSPAGAPEPSAPRKRKKTPPAGSDKAWETLVAIYPSRDGDRRLKDGREIFMRLMAEGENPAVILAGVQGYRDWAEETDHVGTRYVKQIPTYLNDRTWEESLGSPSQTTVADKHERLMAEWNAKYGPEAPRE